MRVIAGSQKGRHLRGPQGPGLRPTSDRVKEALFSILAPHIEGARFLDLYAGTGAIGIEALSRGAQEATFVETHRASLRILHANLQLCGLTSLADVRTGTAEVFLKRQTTADRPYDLVFADPPYHEAEHGTDLLSALAASAIMTPDCIVVLEHYSKLTLPSQVGCLVRLRQYRYGDTTLSVFRQQPEGAPSP
ncbi:MAG: 16S rRNA (guanine(966)-N(2))-methyltransferase RsmD [Nitrospirae bacterium]|nr:16S rRNA (guanine(966)-N(2))-methyltransferase RsmD [Nitrospirota bacterium]